jgi:hypothetical protein
MGPALADPKTRKVDLGVGPGALEWALEPQAGSPLQENAHEGVQGGAACMDHRGIMKYHEAHARLLFGSQKTSQAPIIWIGKPRYRVRKE